MKKRLFVLIIIALALALVMSGCGYAASETGSGIKGKAILGPLEPVSQQGEANEKAYAGAVIIIKDSSGTKEIARAKTAQDGSFSLILPEGSYIVEGVSPDGIALPYAASFSVQVEKDTYTEVTVSFDTGIR